MHVFTSKLYKYCSNNQLCFKCAGLSHVYVVTGRPLFHHHCSARTHTANASNTQTRCNINHLLCSAVFRHVARFMANCFLLRPHLPLAGTNSSPRFPLLNFCGPRSSSQLSYGAGRFSVLSLFSATCIRTKNTP